MRRITSRVRWTALLALMTVAPLAGCVTLQLPEPQADDSPGSRYMRLRDSLAVANAPDMGEESGVPRIRLQPSSTISPARYVDATFRVSGDAYVLVVAVDLDRRVRVLYPESPDESGFVRPLAPQRLTRFFAGFANPGRSSFSTFSRGVDRLSQSGPNGGGVFLAIASDRPFQFDRIAPSGEWDEKAIEQLIFETSPSSAAQALGRALSLTGQEFSTDYTGFFGRGNYGAYSLAAYDATGGSCDAFAAQLYGRGSGGFSSLSGLTPFTGTFVYNNVRYARYVIGGDSCSGYRTLDIPIGEVNPNAPVVPVTPRQPGDTGSGRHFLPKVPADTAGAGHHFIPTVKGEAAYAPSPLTTRASLRFRPLAQVEEYERNARERWLTRDRAGAGTTARERNFGNELEAGRPVERHAEQVRPRQEQPRQEQPRQEQPRQEQPRQEQPRQEQPQHFVPQSAPAAPASAQQERSRPQKDPQR